MKARTESITAAHEMNEEAMTPSETTLTDAPLKSDLAGRIAAFIVSSVNITSDSQRRALFGFSDEARELERQLAAARAALREVEPVLSLANSYIGRRATRSWRDIQDKEQFILDYNAIKPLISAALAPQEGNDA